MDVGIIDDFATPTLSAVSHDVVIGSRSNILRLSILQSFKPIGSFFTTT